MNEGLEDCGRASVGRYNKGCRCDACRRLAVQRVKRYRLQCAKGEQDALVSARRAQRRLRKLRMMGYSDDEFARFGVHQASYIISGKQKRIRRSTEEKVLAISGRRLDRRERVDARPAKALIDRWKGAGVSHAKIAEMSGVGRRTIDCIARGRETVTAITLQRLLRAKRRIDDEAAFLIENAEFSEQTRAEI